MKPIKPKDFQIFYNLVDFCQYVNHLLFRLSSILILFIFLFNRDLLQDQHPDLFQKWIFRFLYDIITASTKFVKIIYYQ